MSDLISRQAAIDAIGELCSCTLDEEARWREIIGRIPSAQPETHEERTETHACDYISRQAVDKIIDDLLENDNLQASPSVWHGLHVIKQLPSAQQEIIRCGDCKFFDDRPGWQSCQAFGKWFGETEMYANDFCSKAERREDG